MTPAAFARRLETHDSLLLVTHRHADRDSLGSAVGLHETLDAETAICLPDGAGAAAKPLLEGRETVTTPTVNAYDAVVVLDAPSTNRIAPVDPAEWAGALYLVDHHTRGDLAEAATAAFVETDAGSTAELVHRVVDAGGWERSPTAATALLAGILSDTGFLADAGAEQVAAVTDLFVDARGNETAIASLFPPSESEGRRMAVFKGVIRADGYGAGETVVATTRVGAEEAAAATALLDAGADAAFAVSDQGDHARVVGRCTDAFAEELSLGGELFPSLSADGGGHDAAGTVRLSNVAPAAAATAIVEEIERQSGVTFGSVE